MFCFHIDFLRLTCNIRLERTSNCPPITQIWSDYLGRLWIFWKPTENFQKSRHRGTNSTNPKSAQRSPYGNRNPKNFFPLHRCITYPDFFFFWKGPMRRGKILIIGPFQIKRQNWFIFHIFVLPYLLAIALGLYITSQYFFFVKVRKNGRARVY